MNARRAVITVSRFVLYLLAFRCSTCYCCLEGIWRGAPIRDVRDLLGSVLMLWSYLTPMHLLIEEV